MNVAHLSAGDCANRAMKAAELLLCYVPVLHMIKEQDTFEVLGKVLSGRVPEFL